MLRESKAQKKKVDLRGGRDSFELSFGVDSERIQDRGAFLYFLLFWYVN
jgi:hypothetical protein